MLIAHVIGELISTHKTRKPRRPQGTDRSAPSIWTDLIAAIRSSAFDAVDAGVGDRVLLVTEGFSAMTSVGAASVTHRHGRWWGRNRQHRTRLAGANAGGAGNRPIANPDDQQ